MNIDQRKLCVLCGCFTLKLDHERSIPSTHKAQVHLEFPLSQVGNQAASMETAPIELATHQDSTSMEGQREKQHYPRVGLRATVMWRSKKEEGRGVSLEVGSAWLRVLWGVGKTVLLHPPILDRLDCQTEGSNSFSINE